MSRRLPTSDDPVKILTGDCRDELGWFSDNTFGAVVTDPPYGIGFMDKDWDHGVPGVHFWKEITRVCKPGTHLVAFGGSRTWHRLACAIEDAGWQIRDCLMWLYGQGFPKSLDVGKELSGEWDGWGTAIKPAYEPIILARKPLIGTVVENILAYGVGAINITGCRVEAGKDYHELEVRQGAHHRHDVGLSGNSRNGFFKPATGRWPANIVHDGSEEVLEAFAAFGERVSTGGSRGGSRSLNFGMGAQPDFKPGFGDTGTAARFFYCAKASTEDRDEGLGELVAENGVVRRTERNNHPTVKPTELMRWLTRLITPLHAIVLDPFAGSGSTGKALIMEERQGVLIELEEGSADIARQRIRHALNRKRDNQGLW